jgi:hypothetical protein
LAALFKSGTFKDNALIADDRIVINIARVDGAVRANLHISSDVGLRWHAGRERRSGVDDGVVPNTRKLVDAKRTQIN